MKKSITFIGLGAMGSHMSANLFSKGFDVRGIDINPAAVKALHDKTGTPVRSLEEACKDSAFLLLMVVNGNQAEDVLFTQKATEYLPKDATIILMATVPPAQAKAIGDKLAAMGLAFVDAPVSGGVAGAAAASLSIMAAAEESVYQRTLPVFQALGQRLFHVGTEAGQGSAVKAINQLFCGTHIAIMAEAFSLAKKAGVDLNLVFDVVSESSASSWMIKDRGPRMISDSAEVTSAVDIFVKDLSIVLAAGADYKAAVPLAAIAYQMFAAASGRGEGKLDDSKVIHSYDLLNGIAE